MEELNDLINYLKNTKEYQTCLDLQDKMNDNKELMKLIEEIKELQKKYIRSNYDSSIKEKLDNLNEELNNIPIYNIYMNNLREVNYKLDYVRDSLNDYFDKLLN